MVVHAFNLFSLRNFGRHQREDARKRMIYILVILLSIIYIRTEDGP